MRIRKNVKVSPLTYPASSPNPGAVVQTYICRLNQSPWDLMSISPPASPLLPPPPPSEVSRNDVCAKNECSLDDAPVVERKFNIDQKHESIAIGEQPHDVKDKHVNFCCKNDGKGWQCRRKAAKGNSLCEHHLSLANNYNLNQSKKSKSSIVEAQRRTRPRRTFASSSSNTHEFYYYSGFGPSWGKKRGESSKDNCGDMSQNVEHEHELNMSLLS